MADNNMRDSWREIDKLTHKIARFSHVEEACLEARLAIRLLKHAKLPLDKKLEECESKVEMLEADLVNLDAWSLQWFFLKITCGLEGEKARVRKDLIKAKTATGEKKALMSKENEIITNQEDNNKENETNYGLLQDYRENLSELLDSALSDTTATTELKDQADGIREQLGDVEEKDGKIQNVRELLKEASSSILEAIVELRQTSKEDSIDKGKVYFPERAFNALKLARELCPELPEIERPQSYEKKPDEHGVSYSPMQSYLRDVRDKVTGLVDWCECQEIDLMKKEAKLTIALGRRTDEWNQERRTVIRQSLIAQYGAAFVSQ